jgi:hypothetical protein
VGAEEEHGGVGGEHKGAEGEQEDEIVFRG